jgi:phage tail-like protein
MADTGVSLRFEVTIDGIKLATFTSCEGIGAEYAVKDYEEGGENGFVHKLPGRMKYTPIKLTRAIDGDSAVLSGWFSSLAVTVKRQTASISVYDNNGERLAQWNLEGVYPSKYTGPSLTADGNQVAKETLELMHNGFMGEMGGVGGVAAGAKTAKGWV